MSDYILSDKGVIMFPSLIFKLKCPKCGYSKIIKQKGDIINPLTIITTCPKCGSEMEEVEFDTFDRV
jgi:endogenous inhibitor of DNA gyrase (YacG/DUF329 family)